MRIIHLCEGDNNYVREIDLISLLYVLSILKLRKTAQVIENENIMTYVLPSVGYVRRNDAIVYQKHEIFTVQHSRRR